MTGHLACPRLRSQPSIQIPQQNKILSFAFRADFLFLDVHRVRKTTTQKKLPSDTPCVLHLVCIYTCCVSIHERLPFTLNGRRFFRMKALLFKLPDKHARLSVPTAHPRAPHSTDVYACRRDQHSRTTKHTRTGTVTYTLRSCPLSLYLHGYAYVCIYVGGISTDTYLSVSL